MNKDAYQHRAITTADAALVLGWRNQERVRKFMYTQHVISQKEHEAWMQKILPTAENYRIFEHQGRPIGFASLYDVNEANKRCYWAFYLGVEDAPKGSGSVMEFMMLDYVFLTRAFHKLCCEVFSFNQSVISLHTRFGFQQESHFKEHSLREGVYEDVVGLALFDREWQVQRPVMQHKLFGE